MTNQDVGAEISLSQLGVMVLRHWRLIVFVPLVLAVVGGVWALSSPRTYETTATFLPQTNAGGSSGGLVSGLARQLGVQVGDGENVWTPELYAQLFRSRSILSRVAARQYRVATPRGADSVATLDEWLGVDAGLSRVERARRAVEALRESMSVSVDRQTGVLTLKVWASQASLPPQIADSLLAVVRDFNREVRSGKTSEDVRFILDQLEESGRLLSAAEDSLQVFLRQNRGFSNSPELLFEHDRLQRSVAMRQELHTSLMRGREQIRLETGRNVPFLTVIDRPLSPAEQRGRGTVRRVVFGALIGFALALVAAFVFEMARAARDTDPNYGQLRELAMQAKEDVRQPRRWFRVASK